MALYERGTVWGDGGILSADALNAEFDRIAAVLNGGLNAENFGEDVGDGLVINAGDDRFNPGGLEPAERIASAITEATQTEVKVVWVPRILWGYVEDATFSTEMFDSTVLMVREGQLYPHHDVIAYGAKVDDATVDDRPAFVAADAGAAASASGANPGSRVVQAALPGSYELSSDLQLSSGVRFEAFPGVTIATSKVLAAADEVLGFRDLPGLAVREFQFETQVVIAESTGQQVDLVASDEVGVDDADFTFDLTKNRPLIYMIELVNESLDPPVRRQLLDSSVNGFVFASVVAEIREFFLTVEGSTKQEINVSIFLDNLDSVESRTITVRPRIWFLETT